MITRQPKVDEPLLSHHTHNAKIDELVKTYYSPSPCGRGLRGGGIT